ncbi:MULTISPECIES: uroporphyrinogen-III C-methyltransferase [Brachymonas]|uniref:uroporphyrinogen-III C-methyltransferase n=1 Tax=Brachymonas TaxID=28219 RepID=UPI002E785A05|nr:uroporphyrinogen-III C-methyltransferase [Brachymonas sp. J145]MEE1653468.1 uroporphyrinogen-III C-methyltransferase [Brachymonas sp. J145]
MTISDQTDAAIPAPMPVNAPPAAARAGMSALARVGLVLALILALLAMAGVAYLWQDARRMQRQIATQVADMNRQASELQAVAELASRQSQDATARTALLSAKVAEFEGRNAQVDSVLQGLARAKDENLLVDIDAAIQMGWQQSQLTGGVQPLLAGLVSAQNRLRQAAQPKLLPLEQSIGRDIERLRQTSESDVTMLLGRIDGVLREIDGLPLQSNLVRLNERTWQAQASSAASLPSDAPWWQRSWAHVSDTFSDLVRVRTIESRDAALLQPQQGYYLRENIKLQLLNARMALLARQPEVARSDVQQVRAMMSRYFQSDAQAVRSSLLTLEEVGNNIHVVQLPTIQETQAALAAAQNAAALAAPVIVPALPAASAASAPAPAQPAASAATVAASGA